MLINALDLVAKTVARTLRPPPRIEIWEWSEKHRVMPSEVTATPGPYRVDTVPFSREIQECLAPWHPSKTVTVCCSAQVSKSVIGENFMMALADLDPGPMMMVFPTTTAAGEYYTEKLNPAIKSARRIRQILDMSESKSKFLKFPGGFWILAGANSSKALSSRSIRYMVKDEWDRWPAEIEGQGDPDSLANARLKSYTRSGKAKIYQASTPVELTTSRIWAAFLAGDQRRYYVPCPDCGEFQVLRFQPKTETRKDGKEIKKGGLVFNPEPPFEACYSCEHCGVLIEHYHKDEMLAAGEWRAESPGEGKQPSFHINALYSPFETWDSIAEDFVDKKDDPTELKAFVNLTLGEPWEERGEAPEWERLYRRRDDYAARSIPAGGLIVVTLVDVQADGFYYETQAFGYGATCWSIDIGFLEGNTADENDPVYRKLDELYERRFLDAYGNDRQADRLGIDGGYNSNQVYIWARGKPRAMVLKGQPGWYHPPIGTHTKVDVTVRGKKRRRGVKLYPVGTWSLKSELYAHLRKDIKPGSTEIPPGYRFYSSFHDEGFFKQLTAEFIKDVKRRGKVVREWHAAGPNHYHDLGVYGLGIYHHLTQGWRAEQWERLAEIRNVPPERVQGDLFGGIGGQPPPSPKPSQRPRRGRVISEGVKA